jgi:hypothetical protein
MDNAAALIAILREVQTVLDQESDSPRIPELVARHSN